jgi:hypothetical protein
MRWNLTDPAYGGDPSLDTKTVWVRLRDATGKTTTIQHSIDLVATRPGTPYSRAVRADSPVSHWRFDEPSTTFGAQDEVGGNHGQFGGSPTLGAPGLLASEPTHTAAGFHGHDYAYFSHTSAQDLTTNMSVEAWIRPSSFPAGGSYASVVSKPESYSLQFRGSQLEWTVIVDPAADPSADRGRERLLLDPGAIPLDKTSHVVATYDGSVQRLYVNGVLAKSQALTIPAQVTSSEITVGSWQYGLSEYFDGTVDEVALYPTALPLARIEAHYDLGHTPAVPPLAPQSLNAAGTSPTQIGLTWNVAAHDESSFVLQRSTDPDFSGPTQIDVAENRTAYTDSGLSPSRTYWYRLRAINPVGFSDWSNVAVASTQAPSSNGGGQPPSDATQQTGATPDHTRPSAALSLTKQTLRRVLSRGLTLRVKTSEPGRVSTDVWVAPAVLGKSGRKSIRIGRASKRLTKAGTASVVVKLSASARKKLLHKRSVKLKVQVKVTDAAGNASRTVGKTVTLRR